MTTYLFTFRAPAEYTPSSDTFEAWSAWQLDLGARLKDRGNPGFAATTVGAAVSETTLGGYSLIRAGSLDAAAALARHCPLLAHGGAVEICELTSHDERFDDWLDTARARIAPVEITMRIPAAPGEVFRYFTDPARYVQWMGGEARLTPAPGGEYYVSMPDGFAAAGQFVAVEAPHRVVFTWGFADDEAAQRTKNPHAESITGSAMPAGSTHVTVTLADEDGGTRLTLRHDDMPSPELREGHDVAWTMYLQRLAIRAAGGDPGPDPHSAANG